MLQMQHSQLEVAVGGGSGCGEVPALPHTPVLLSS